MIKKDYIVEKRNMLNEIRCNNMSFQELRFFTIYLAKIDSRKVEETRKVTFTLSDFLAIMEIGKINIKALKNTTNSLLSKVINIPTGTGGYIGFQLFKKCRVEKREGDKWYVEIDAHDDALPLMFEFKEMYFTYKLWNALRLGSVNQLRMYEILKQYEKKGSRTILVKELKELLFIGENEYSRFNNFKVKVLDACKKSLKENTDISYDYEFIKEGRGGKITEIKFTITKNLDYNDNLSLEEFVGKQIMPEITVDDGSGYFAGEAYPFLSEACKHEFTLEEMQVLYDSIIKLIPWESVKDGANGYLLEVFDYLKMKYDELNWRACRVEVKNRFGYMKKLVESF